MYTIGHDCHLTVWGVQASHRVFAVRGIALCFNEMHSLLPGIVSVR